MLSAKVRVGTVDSIDNPFEHEVTASIPGSETRSGSGRREEGSSRSGIVENKIRGI